MRDLHKIRTLYIDDMSTVRNVLKKIFEELHVESVDSASNGSEAWTKIREASTAGKPYDLILCDWHMPELLGIDLVGMLRLDPDPNIRNVRFVMITGSDEKIRQAIERGVDNFIAKPFSADQLRKKIEFVFRFDAEPKLKAA